MSDKHGLKGDHLALVLSFEAIAEAYVQGERIKANSAEASELDPDEDIAMTEARAEGEALVERERQAGLILRAYFAEHSHLADLHGETVWVGAIVERVRISMGLPVGPEAA